jgi:hypothetical protein
MEAQRPDRVVRFLTSLVSFLYYGAWVVAAKVVVIGPLLKLLVPGLLHDPSNFGLEVPVNVPGQESAVLSQWATVPPGVRLTELNGDIRLPERLVPAWFNAVLVAGSAVFFALLLMFLHELRALLRRVRAGIPFDAGNATRMRRLGVLLLALYLFFGVFEFWMSAWVVRALDVAVGASPRIDLFAVFIALFLIGLAEVFRRGAALEAEQSLVV